jgi:hypothetical protein
MPHPLRSVHRVGSGVVIQKCAGQPKAFRVDLGLGRDPRWLGPLRARSGRSVGRSVGIASPSLDGVSLILVRAAFGAALAGHRFLLSGRDPVETWWVGVLLLGAASVAVLAMETDRGLAFATQKSVKRETQSRDLVLAQAQAMCPDHDPAHSGASPGRPRVCEWCTHTPVKSQEARR